MFDNREADKQTRQKLWKQYFDKLVGGLHKGYSPEPELYDAELVTALTQNLAEFSAFKEESFNEVLRGLLNSSKTLPTWKEFRNEVVKIDKKYNRSWLEAEYHHTVAKANMTQKFQEFEADVDLYPNLKFKTVGDARVRDEHRPLNGMVAPVNSPIWSTYTPPLDWGCRCTLVQTDEPVTSEVSEVEIKKEFKNNPINTKKIFTENAYENTIPKVTIKKAKARGREFLSKVGDMIKTRNPKVTIHPNADLSDLRRNYQVADIIAKQLDVDILIREHFETGTTNPEYLIRGTYLGDRKSISGINNIRGNFAKAKKQMFNKIVNPEQKPYHIVYDLDLIDELNLRQFIINLNANWNQNKGRNIKSIFFQYKGKAIEVTGDEFLIKDYSKFRKLL